MFQETRTRHLRARNAADKGEESMTGMRFFVNLIPEAVKRRPRERASEYPPLHRDFLASAADEMEREKRNGEGQTDVRRERERRGTTTVYRFSRRPRPGAAEVTSHRGPHAHIAFCSLSKDNDPS